MSLPKLGSKAPAFSAPTQTGEIVSLKELLLQDKPVVLFFYPKDDTPGCTVEACSFRDAYATLRKKATLLGVSPDPADKHEKFAAKFKLPYPLLADTEKEIVAAYGVWIEKALYGKKYMGVARTTFIIDAKGKIAKIFEKVKPEGHAGEVLAALKDL
ncbi:peroxiredoxin Q/BCP [Verrucomicrobium sp. GAS474]|uniref:thioredoxin-dependent thiol peroxidase n=1 Tax=Verrucomicrobium sp. GAS474 TaxID=1882831 RepID=UPI00087D0A42|nr:thioredoxin-dependent thiol peroxidase [Verrucomicrobium sp. GAS474]SDU26339.1 peroxiredoxin Q/BCP [Verrucomicrobium sp. GAS474]